MIWYQSSQQAERGFCSICGSNVFWRLKDDDNKTSESNLEKLKNILNNNSDNVNKENTINKQDNIIVKDRNYISKEQFNDEFRGWGFTFF